MTDPLTEAGEQVRKWTRKRDRLMLQARRDGWSLRAIAEKVGLSHTSVDNITTRQEQTA